MDATLTLLGISGKLILLQAIPFVLALVGLHFIIFKPVLALLAEREKNIHGFKKEAELLQEEVDARLSELEVKLTDARAQAMAERNRLRQEALESEQEFIAAARERSEQVIEEARGVLAAEQATARAQLEAAAQGLSKDIASRLLGREIGES